MAGEVERLLGDPDARVRTQALLFVSQHAHVDPLTRIAEVADFDDVSMRCALIAFLARPGAGQNLEAARLILAGMVGETGAAGQRTRQEAARLLGSLPNHFERELRVLLDDEDDEVARQAIRSVGRLCKRPYVEHVVARLATPSLAAEAADALAACGDRVVGALRDRLVDGEERIDLRRQIPAVLRRIGSPAAKDALLENMAAGDTILRSRIIEALDDWRQARPDEPFDDEVVETVLLAEVLGHYRSYEILGTLGLAPGGDDPVTRGLRVSMDRELDRIFRLLRLRFPSHDVYGAYLGIRSSNPAIRDKGLELLDHVLVSPFRSLLMPLVDPETTLEERIERAARVVGRGSGNREEAVTALIYSEDPNLRACGTYSIGALHLRSLRVELDRFLDDPDPLLRETARLSREQVA